ncbi:MAG: oligosaccharide flippase family protein, partial [Pseudomonadota bacterium]
MNHTANRSLRRILIEGSAGGLIISAVSTALLFAVSILLTRTLGAAGYGAYAYALSWTTILGIVAGLGLTRMLVRNIAAYLSNQQFALVHGQIRWASRSVLVASTLTAASAWGLAQLVGFPSDLLGPFLIALLMLPLVSLVRVNQAILQGLHRVVLGQLAEPIVQPLFFLALILAALLVANEVYDPSVVTALH